MIIRHLPSDLVLRKGSHDSPGKYMCVMEAVAHVAGELHSDHPECACPVVTEFCVGLNDALPDDKRQRLVLLILRIAGSRSTPDVERRRSLLALDWLVRVYTPMWLELVEDLAEHASMLRDSPEIVDMETAQQAAPRVRAAENAAENAENAGWSATRAVSWGPARVIGEAAWAAAWAAAGPARDAAVGAANAAGAAASAAEVSLRPIVDELQDSAILLLERMLEVRDE